MPQFVGAPELFGLRIGDPVERQVAASRDVTATTPRPKLVGGALKPAGRARVDDLFATARDVGTDRLFVAHQLGAKARGELPRWDAGCTGFERPALGPPFRQTAIEQCDIVVPEQAQHPPGAAGR